MTGYTRKDVSNSIAEGNIIDPSVIDSEYDGIVDAFHASTGHTHGGATGEGAPITVTGPNQEYVSSATDFTPKTDSTYDLGTTSVRWANGYFDSVSTLALVAGSVTVPDTSLSITDDGDSTKVLKFNASNITTSTTRTLSVPDYDGTIATVAGTETLTNKTLTSPVLNTADINDPDIDGGTIDGATITGGSISGITDLAVADGGTGASNATTARSNLGLVIGTNVQAYDAGLQSIAGLTTAADRMIYTTASDVYAVTPLTAAGRALIDDASASAQRTTLGLGTLATLNTINNGNWSGTDLAVTNGGTGASDAATARSNLGLGTGASPQFADLLIQDTTPVIDLYDTDATAARARSRLLRDGDTFRISTREDDGTAVSNDYEMTVGSSGATEHVWNIEGTRAFTIDSNGDAGFGAVSVSTAQVYSFAATGNAFRGNTGSSSNNSALDINASNPSFTNDISRITSTRTASSSFDFMTCRSDFAGSPDVEFRLSGNGNGTCDGAWTGGGADFAEFFEWLDGNTNSEDRRGISVVIQDGKVRPATANDSASSIVGAVSSNASIVGDGDIGRWKNKYLKDDFGSYVMEEYQTEGGVTQERRKLNPDYDPELEYISREDRPEWDLIGLVGKVRILKGQPTGDRWTKMRDISDSVEEWLVR